MKENRKFKNKYDELRNGKKTKEDSPSGENSTEAESEKTRYDTPSPSRTICFVWANGRRMFFNYSYLVSGELNIEGETNVITLRFTSDIVTLKGYGLEELFSQLIKQTSSLILQSDERYSSDNDPHSLTDIIVTPSI